MDPSRAAVVMPLYIYPLSDQTWKPLYDSISAHRTVDFLVVVNPNSGPGDKALPGHDYEREVPKLNAEPNVYTVGYIRIDYCRKPLHDVCEEIDRYAGWAEDFDQRGLGVKGIFLDETPNHHSAGRALYLEAVHKHIRATTGIQGKRLIFHNPGTPPDAGLAPTADPGPDVIFTCEEPYERYRGDEVQKRLRDYPYEHARTGYMISGVPKDEIQTVAREFSQRAAYVFVTDLVDDFYESFGESWSGFVSAMDPAAHE